MKEKVIETLNNFGMLQNTASITVALSGGADSVALTHILYTLKDEFSFKLSAAHFNHHIRGEEAENDQRFCEDFCKKLGIELTVEDGDVPRYAKDSKKSIELAAREMRYNFLSSLKSDKIATAHTASDNLETVIFNLARGTGSDGLCGIPPQRDKYIRPLIMCTRHEIETYCKENGLSFVTDSTNLLDDANRNIIRHRIVPVLKQINNSVEMSVQNTSSFVSKERHYLEMSAEPHFKAAFKDGKLFFNDLKNIDDVLKIRVLKRYFEEISLKKQDAFHINAVLNILDCGGKVSLPENKYAVCKENVLWVEENTKNTRFSVNLEIIDDDFFKKGLNVNNLLLKNCFDCDKIVGDLEIRTRKIGDKIKLCNKDGTKTFKKLYNEYKIPLCERENLPVISDASGPVWIYKIGVAERCAVTKQSKKIYLVSTNVLE